MQNDFFYDVLDQRRRDILPLFQNFRSDFYLAGGTALALQIGHRDSIDFDFFSLNSFSTAELFQKIEQVFADYRILKIQEAKDTLTIILNNEIKISFFSYQYPLVKPFIETEYFQMASLEDIACMKLSAITSRSLMKDYIDLYYIFQKLQLGDLLNLLKDKYPRLDINLVLKSLVYFDDIVEEPIIFKHHKSIDLLEVKNFLNRTVKNYLNS